MYRDDSTLLDEHDRAVGAIQIADGVLAGCFQASKQLASAEHRWRAVREIHDDYGEVWRQLDAARQILASRGANTMGFDELREHAVRVLALEENGVDTRPLEDARRAIAELRLAMPGADWKGIEARTRGLATGAKLIRSGQRTFVFAGVALALLLGASAWSASARATTAVDPRVAERLEMQKDLDGVVNERKDRIEQLSLLIGGRCDRDNVVELVKLLAMDGRWNDAHVYGVDYMRRCKDDDGQVRKWAEYSKKKLDRLSKL
jgi:hypothetical protein